MNGPFADEYWKAAEREIDTLEGIYGWDVIECEDDMNVINGTWAFECKQFPNGTVKSLKPAFVLMKISSWKELNSLRSMPPLRNGPLST